MSYSSKVNAALAILASTGMRRSNYAPPMHRLLWRLGIQVPPPHFASFAFNPLLSGFGFGICWGLIMWFALWSADGVAGVRALAMCVSGGILFGLLMAIYYRWGASKYKLPSWAQVEGQDEPSST